MWGSRVVACAAMDWLIEKHKEKSKGRNLDGKEVYLEWEYTKYGINDFEFKHLVVLP